MSDSQTNLDEIAAPAPIHDLSETPLGCHDYLESSHSNRNQDEHLHPDERQHERKFQDSRVESEYHSSKVWRNIHIISHLTLFSFIGTLLRIAIEFLTFYPGAPISTSVLWANFGGSLIMGFLSEGKNLFAIDNLDARKIDLERNETTQQRKTPSQHRNTPPLYIGLTTGFCGSLTSFSTFIRDVFLATVNSLPVPLGRYPDLSLFTPPPAEAKAPDGGFSFMAILAVLLTEIGLSLAGLFIGGHLAIGISPWTPSISLKVLRVLNHLVLALAILAWVAVICLVVLLSNYGEGSTIWSAELWRGPVLYSLVFSPLGCLARFFLSLNLNGKIPSFPLGTFASNIFGTMVLGMAYSLQHASIGGSALGGGSILGCQVLQGIMDGFCGCLTTVSTWVLELSGLRRRHAYFYGAISVIVAFCALIVEMGSLTWTLGLTTPVCFAH
ncbi:hypothetical protein MYU51_013041 [Penicillium brevicompactum]